MLSNMSVSHNGSTISGATIEKPTISGIRHGLTGPAAASFGADEWTQAGPASLQLRTNFFRDTSTRPLASICAARAGTCATLYRHPYPLRARKLRERSVKMGRPSWGMLLLGDGFTCKRTPS